MHGTATWCFVQNKKATISSPDYILPITHQAEDRTRCPEVQDGLPLKPLGLCLCSRLPPPPCFAPPPKSVSLLLFSLPTQSSKHSVVIPLALAGQAEALECCEYPSPLCQTPASSFCSFSQFHPMGLASTHRLSGLSWGGVCWHSPTSCPEDKGASPVFPVLQFRIPALTFQGTLGRAPFGRGEGPPHLQPAQRIN